MEYLILSEYKHINETNLETMHKKVYTPDMDVSGESQEVQDLADEHWTQEVKDAWAAKLLADQPPEQDE
jgi:hypothetical protein|tara:strand:+ start:4121 stop:4327 length:207 start_codon:yes stop_codon:yes gene_type:complete